MNTIRYFDPDSQTIVKIPKSQLASGAVCARMEGVEGEIWTLPVNELKCDQVGNSQAIAHSEDRDFKHPAFNQNVRMYIEQIQTAFAEHYPISFEEWENGFRRDENASQQIAIWWYAAKIYVEFAENEPCEHRRTDIYRCVFNCMIASREDFWNVYHPNTISCSEAQKIVDRYYMVGSAENTKPST